ncbi:hypothetical protein ACA910_013810 [Epithemia clementina (nom. ined.)]
MDTAIAATEYKVSVLKTLIGDRSDAQGTSSIIELLEDLEDRSTPVQAVRFEPSPKDEAELKALTTKPQLLNQEVKQFKSQITGSVHAEIKQSFASNLFNLSCSFQSQSCPAYHSISAQMVNNSKYSRGQAAKCPAISGYSLTAVGTGSFSPSAPSGLMATNPTLFGWGMSAAENMAGPPPSGGTYPGSSHGLGNTASFEANVQEKIKGLQDSIEAICD